MPASGSPTVRRRQLAAELRLLRGNRTGSEVSRALGWSKSKISRYEIGRTTLPVDEVVKLLDCYDVTGSKRDQLLALARDANERGWWEDYNDSLREEHRAFIGLEAEASAIMHWQVDVVPGLLQTEAYAKKMHVGYQKVVTSLLPGTVDRRVEVRMMRQQVLTREPPLELSVVIDESVLLRRVGRRELMHEQLQHLVHVADRPNVQLRVLPMSTESSLRTASFVILSFGGSGPGALDDVVSTEGVESEIYYQGEEYTYHHGLVFQALVEESLPPAESRKLILETGERVWA
jgi:transcriptional regulator with XRE-family HTH domain